MNVGPKSSCPVPWCLQKADGDAQAQELVDQRPACARADRRLMPAPWPDRRSLQLSSSVRQRMFEDLARRFASPAKGSRLPPRPHPLRQVPRPCLHHDQGEGVNCSGLPRCCTPAGQHINISAYQSKLVLSARRSAGPSSETEQVMVAAIAATTA